jgi:hypothetical protein
MRDQRPARSLLPSLESSFITGKPKHLVSKRSRRKVLLASQLGTGESLAGGAMEYKHSEKRWTRAGKGREGGRG